MLMDAQSDVQEAGAIEADGPSLLERMGKLKVYRINAQEWWLGESLQACIEAAATHHKLDAWEVTDPLFRPHPMPPEEMGTRFVYTSLGVLPMTLAIELCVAAPAPKPCQLGLFL